MSCNDIVLLYQEYQINSKVPVLWATDEILGMHKQAECISPLFEASVNVKAELIVYSATLWFSYPLPPFL